MSYVESFSTKPWLTNHVERECQLSESKPKIDNVNNKSIPPEKQKHDNDTSLSAFENHRNVIIGPSNVGKSF